MAPQTVGMAAILVAFVLCPIAHADSLGRLKREPFIPPPSLVDVSSNPGYRRAAAQFAAAINQTADPCDDFFEFSCGKWVANNPIPADLTSYGHFSELREKVLREMNGKCTA